MKVVFIGLGQMGRPMALRLLDAGHELNVWNRTRSAAAPFALRGAAVLDDAASARDAEVAVTMLADDAAVRVVWLDTGLAARMARGSVHLNMATVSPGIARELAAAHERGGSVYVSAPVYGRPAAAAQGQIDVVAAGPAAAIERCRPLLQAMAKQVFVVGEQACKANAVKIARNFLLAAVVESLGEAFALARKSGVDADAFLNTLVSTSLNAPVYRSYGRQMVERTYEPAQFNMRLGLKDIELALATGREAGVPMPTANLIRAQLLAAIADGRGDQDWTALADHIARAAGL